MDSKAYLNMDLLRFTTAGSVDDGKSTLIGRLLYDSKSIFEDQMEAIERASEKKGEESVNLALLCLIVSGASLILSLAFIIKSLTSSESSI